MVKMKPSFAVFIFICSLGICKSDYYNRSMMENSCPGFGKEWILFPDGEEKPTVVYLNARDEKESRIFEGPDIPENIHFLLYTRHQTEGTELKIDDADTLSTSTFDKSKDTKVVTHGFRSSGRTETCQMIKDEFLKKYDANVIIVDWEELAGQPYFRAATYPQEVGNYTAQLLYFLTENGADAKNMHLVGHSLGAHLMGFTGKGMISYDRKVGRITGLDPAFPGFNFLTGVTGGRLDASDADFVDVIHTCGRGLGLIEPLGDADFYPNGGTPMQPGCSILTIAETCSHGRSWRYFAESINGEEQFISYPCSSWDDFVGNQDCKGEPLPMGDPAPPRAKGIYYLRTSSEFPFALGADEQFANENELFS